MNCAQSVHENDECLPYAEFIICQDTVRATGTVLNRPWDAVRVECAALRRIVSMLARCSVFYFKKL